MKKEQYLMPAQRFGVTCNYLLQSDSYVRPLSLFSDINLVFIQFGVEKVHSGVEEVTRNVVL